MEAQLWAVGYVSDSESVRTEIVDPKATASRGKSRKGRKSSQPQRAAMDGYNLSRERGTGDAMAGSHLACLDACSPDTQQLAGLSSCSAPTAAAAACGSTAAIKSTSETATPEPAAPALAAPPASAVRAAPAAAVTSSRSSKKIKQDLAGPCCHCGAVSSPQWRKGPKGKPVLCNACGIRFLRNRTLTKVMPKKRHAGAAASPPAATEDACLQPAKRIRADVASPQDEIELATEEVLPTEDVIATDDGLEEAHSTQHVEHADCTAAAVASAAAAAAASRLADTAAVAAAAAAAAEREVEFELQQLQAKEAAATAARRAAAAAAAAVKGGTSRSSSYCHNLLCPAASGSTHQPPLLCSGSRLGHNASLSLALALHQQQQLQLQVPSSPVIAGVSCIAGSSHTSPVSHTSAYPCNTTARLHRSEGWSGGSGSGPASPLMLGATASSCQLPILGLSSGLDTQQDEQALQWEPPAAAYCSSHALPVPDILQLVQQVASVLGGVGPAVDFVKAMSFGGQSAAAAVEAVRLWQ